MLIVADLNKVSLKEGWYGSVMKEMRRKFMEDDLSGTICDGCVHHKYAKGSEITPEYCSLGDEEFIYDDSLVRKRVAESGFTVYLPMAADIVYSGHINIIKKASQYGEVIFGLFTDEAIELYKRKPYMAYDQRKAVIENIKGVSKVIPQ